MKNIKGCGFNTDTGRVEPRLEDGGMISNDRAAVENEAADDRFRQLEPDCLICGGPPRFSVTKAGRHKECLPA